MYDNLKELFQAIKDITKEIPTKVLAEEGIRRIELLNSSIKENKYHHPFSDTKKHYQTTESRPGVVEYTIYTDTSECLK